jgi:hypothetical protein
MDRETGTETQPCPNCGTGLAVVTNPDGSVGTVNCDSCWPAAGAERAAVAPVVEREYGVDESDDDD